MTTRILGFALLLLTGCCQSFVGPFERSRMPATRIDDPCITIAEQQARGRARLAFPDQTNDLAPRTYAEVPNSSGR